MFVRWRWATCWASAKKRSSGPSTQADSTLSLQTMYFATYKWYYHCLTSTSLPVWRCSKNHPVFLLRPAYSYTKVPGTSRRRSVRSDRMSHFLSCASIWMRRARTVRPSALVNRWIYSREIGTCKYLENPPELNYHPSAGDRRKKVMYLASYPDPLLY